MLRFRLSAFKHDVTEQQVREVLANKWEMTKWFEFDDDANGNSQDMVVGFDAEGLLLEIGVTYLNEDEVVFHADEATTHWMLKYNEG